jgi:multidrug efflux pump subunit AcrA (membrane-fusion protein)
MHSACNLTLTQSLLKAERRAQENGQLVAEVQALRRELAALRQRAGSRLGATAAEAAAEEAGAALRAENQALQAAMAALRAELALRCAPQPYPNPSPTCPPLDVGLWGCRGPRAYSLPCANFVWSLFEVPHVMSQIEASMVHLESGEVHGQVIHAVDRCWLQEA